MSQRPERCHAPDNVWFANQQMAVRNALRKQEEGLGFWRVWGCYDHWHVSPKQKWMINPS